MVSAAITSTKREWYAYVAAQVLGAVGELAAEQGGDAPLDVVDGQRFDTLGPDGDAVEQGAGLVLPRLANGEDGIQVDMGLDQRRRDQRAPKVDDLPGVDFRLGYQPVPHADLPGVGFPGDSGALQE